VIGGWGVSPAEPEVIDMAVEAGSIRASDDGKVPVGKGVVHADSNKERKQSAMRESKVDE
jgi:hypothetical protein